MSSDDPATSSADISSSSSSYEDIIAACEQQFVNEEAPSDHGSGSFSWIPCSAPLSCEFDITIDSKDSPRNACPVSLVVQKLHSRKCSSDSAVVFEDSYALADETDLMQGSDDAFVAAGKVEHQRSGTQVAVGLGLESSQEVQEQSMQSKGLSSIVMSNGYTVDGCVGHASSEDGNDKVKVSEQPGIKRLVAAEAEYDDYDDVEVCTTNQVVVKEDLFSASDQKPQEAELLNGFLFWCGSCQTADASDDDHHLHVCRPRSQRFESLTSSGRTVSLSLSQLNLQFSRDFDDIEGISMPGSHQGGQINCGSFRRRTVSLPRLTLVAAEASQHMQQMLESAICEWQNQCGETDPVGTSSVSVIYPNWSSDENMCVSVNEQYAALPVAETLVSESVRDTDVTVVSGGALSECGVHTELNEHQTESYDSEHHQEQQRKPYATVLLQDDAQQLSFPGVTNLSHIAVASSVTGSICGLHRELDIQEEIKDVKTSGCHAPEETHTDCHDLDRVSDIANGGDKLQSSVILIDEKLPEDNLQLPSKPSNVGIHCMLTENLTGSDEKGPSASPVGWSEPEDKGDHCLGVIANSDVGEGGGDDVRASVEQLLQLADVGDTGLPVEFTSIDVNKSENETQHVAEILSYKSVMVAKLDDMTAREEVSLTAYKNVYDMPSSKSPYVPTEVLSLAQTGQDEQQLASSAFGCVADGQRTEDSCAIEITPDTAVTTQVLPADGGKMPQSEISQANQTLVIRSIDLIDLPIDNLQSTSKFYDRAGLHDTYVREIDDWIDGDTGPAEDTLVTMHSAIAVEVDEVDDTDEQAIPLNGDRVCHVEVEAVKSQLQLGSENIAHQSVTEEKDAREESKSSETQSTMSEISPCSNMWDVKCSNTGAADKENKDCHQMETGDRHVSVVKRAAEVQNGINAGDGEHVHSPGDAVLSESSTNGPSLILYKKPVESFFCDSLYSTFVDHNSATDTEVFTASSNHNHKIADKMAMSVKNERNNASADRTAASNLQAAINDSDSDSHCIAAGITNTTVVQHLVKNISDNEPYVRYLPAMDDNKASIIQWSLTDGTAASSQAMPCVKYSAETHAIHNTCDPGESALATVVDIPGHYSCAKQTCQDYQIPTGKFVESTIQKPGTGNATSIAACAVDQSQTSDQNHVLFCHDLTLLSSVDAEAGSLANNSIQSQVSLPNKIQLTDTKTTDVSLGHLSDTMTDQMYFSVCQENHRNISDMEEKLSDVERLLTHNKTGASPTCSSDDLDVAMTEAVSISTASTLSVIQTDTKSSADEGNRSWPFSVVVSESKMHQPFGYSGVLDDCKYGRVKGPQNGHRMADDMATAVNVQHDAALPGKEHCAYLSLTPTQDQNHEDEGICAIQAEFGSRTCVVNKINQELSGFHEDVDAYKDLVSTQTPAVANALPTDAVFLPVNDFITNVSNTFVEHVAANDVQKLAFSASGDINSCDDTSYFHLKESIYKDDKNIASTGMDMPTIQKTSMVNFIKSSDMMSTTIMDHAQNLDLYANDGYECVCAETSVNVDVPVVADSHTRETRKSSSCAEMMAENSQNVPLPKVGSTPESVHDQFNSDSDSGRLMSSQMQPQQAVSHPAPTENVRTGSKHASANSGAQHHSSSPSQAGWSVMFSDCLPVWAKSVDSRVQNPRGSNSRKRVAELTDTEVLGIDLEPERQCKNIESRLQQSADVEIIMSGHSTIGFGRQTDFQYQSIGLQPVGTQQPRFTPGPEKVLRDEVAEQYPKSFWHCALDIEIRPQTGDDSHEITDETRTRKDTAKTDTIIHREEKDCVTIIQKNRFPDLIRVIGAATNREIAGQHLTAGGESCVFNDSLVETLQSVSGRNPEHRNVTVNCESSPLGTNSSIVSQQYPASQHHIGRSQIYNIHGFDLFRCKSVENMDLTDAENQLVRSYSDMSIISPRRSCRRQRQRRLVQPTLASSSLSKSDHELLGSTSTLFEDLLPNFKDLPFFLSFSGSNRDTDKDKLIRNKSGQINFLPCYHGLPSATGNHAYSKISDHCGHNPAAKFVRPETAYYDATRIHHKDNENRMFGIPILQVTAETDCSQPLANEYINSRSAVYKEVSDDMMDRSQSMDSKTYVFVGHDDNSLKAVSDNCSGMIRYSSEPLSYSCEDTVDMHGHVPVVHSHVCGKLMESSSDNWLLSTNTECLTPVLQSLSCTGVHNKVADNDGYSGDLSSDVTIGHQQLPTSEFQHNEASTQTLCELRLSKQNTPLAASSESAVRANESLHERYAKQPLLSLSCFGKSQRETATQTNQNHQLHHGNVHQLNYASDGSHEIGMSSLNDDKSIPRVLSQSGQEMDALEVAAAVAAKCSVSDTGIEDTPPVDEFLLHNEQLKIGACSQMTFAGESGSHQTMNNSHSIQNLTHRDISAKIHTAQSIPYRMDEQTLLSAEPFLHLPSEQTIETQTYPEMQVTEIQTSNKLNTRGTQTAFCDDVRIQDACLNVPLNDSGSALSTNMHVSTTNRPTSERLSPISFENGVASSQVVMLAANSMPISHSRFENNLHQVVYPHTGVHITDRCMSSATNAAADQLQIVLSPEPEFHATSTADMWSRQPCERPANTRITSNFSSSLTLSLDSGVTHEQTAHISRGGSSPEVHSLLPGSQLEGYHRIVCNSPSVTSAVLTSPDLAACGNQSTQLSANNGGLLAVKTSRESLQNSATLFQSVERGSYSSILHHQDRTADKLDVYHGVSRPLESSSIYTSSPASNSDLEMLRTQDSQRNGTPEGMTNLKTDEILEKYRMKRATDAYYSGNMRNVSNTSYSHHGNYAHLSRSVLHSHTSSYSHVNDSGIVGSHHSLSPPTRTLLGYREAMCDKSAATEPSRRATAGCDAELERLHRERQLIMDLLAREYIPSRIQLELAESHLSYLMGHMDAQLQQISEPPRSHGADFRAFCHARLEASQQHIEAQIQNLETVGKKAHIKPAQLAANLDGCAQTNLAADATEYRCSTDSLDSPSCSTTLSPSQREQFLLGIRREIVSATTARQVTPVYTDSQWQSQNFRRSWPNRGLYSAHSSFLNLDSDDSIHDEKRECYLSSWMATPTSSLQHLDHQQHSTATSSFSNEIDSLLMQCQEARWRARVEIGRAMDTLRQTPPAWTSSPLSSHR